MTTESCWKRGMKARAANDEMGARDIPQLRTAGEALHVPKCAPGDWRATRKSPWPPGRRRASRRTCTPAREVARFEWRSVGTGRREVDEPADPVSRERGGRRSGERCLARAGRHEDEVHARDRQGQGMDAPLPARRRPRYGPRYGGAQDGLLDPAGNGGGPRYDTSWTRDERDELGTRMLPQPL